MYSLAGLFWRNDLGCASVIPSEQTASSYIILYIVRNAWGHASSINLIPSAYHWGEHAQNESQITARASKHWTTANPCATRLTRSKRNSQQSSAVADQTWWRFYNRSSTRISLPAICRVCIIKFLFVSFVKKHIRVLGCRMIYTLGSFMLEKSWEILFTLITPKLLDFSAFSIYLLDEPVYTTYGIPIFFACLLLFSLTCQCCGDCCCCCFWCC